MPRTFITAFQRETVRLEKDKQPYEKMHLATIGLTHCVALVVFTPTRLSLMHLDSNTDLNFIREELIFCGKEATLTLLRRDDTLPDLLNKVKTFITTNHSAHSVSSRVLKPGKDSVIANITEKRTLAIYQGKTKHFNEILFKESHGHDISADNILKKDTVLAYSKNLQYQQCAVYETQLNGLLSSRPLKPFLVFDGESFSNEAITLTHEAAEKLESYKNGASISALLSDKDLSPLNFQEHTRSLEYILPKYLPLKAKLETQEITSSRPSP